MTIESKIEIGHDSMFNVYHANFKSAHLLHKMARGFIFNPTTVPAGNKIYKKLLSFAMLFLKRCLSARGFLELCFQISFIEH